MHKTAFLLGSLRCRSVSLRRSEIIQILSSASLLSQSPIQERPSPEMPGPGYAALTVNLVSKAVIFLSWCHFCLPSSSWHPPFNLQVSEGFCMLLTGRPPCFHRRSLSNVSFCVDMWGSRCGSPGSCT